MITMCKISKFPRDRFVRKSKELYGFFDAQRFMQKVNLIVVEGYFDVISMHQAGLKHCWYFGNCSIFYISCNWKKWGVK